jgi:hypothetical protein
MSRSLLALSRRTWTLSQSALTSNRILTRKLTTNPTDEGTSVETGKTPATPKPQTLPEKPDDPKFPENLLPGAALELPEEWVEEDPSASTKHRPHVGIITANALLYQTLHKRPPFSRHYRTMWIKPMQIFKPRGQYCDLLIVDPAIPEIDYEMYIDELYEGPDKEPESDIRAFHAFWDRYNKPFTKWIREADEKLKYFNDSIARLKKFIEKRHAFALVTLPSQRGPSRCLILPSDAEEEWRATFNRGVTEWLLYLQMKNQIDEPHKKKFIVAETYDATKVKGSKWKVKRMLFRWQAERAVEQELRNNIPAMYEIWTQFRKERAKTDSDGATIEDEKEDADEGLEADEAIIEETKEGGDKVDLLDEDRRYTGFRP